MNLLFREFSSFFRNAFGSIFSMEFATVAIPLIILWELLPRFELVPPTLVPTPSKVAQTFIYMVKD
ncbi:MAG TPA: hypothetical protein VLL97_10450, partial [Acidobacteriota bacterium]|nr:hypothetical protein [Acidobacteriota bacterium]